MIDRYSLSPMSDLFTEEAKFTRWRDIEILALEGWAEVGAVPGADVKYLRKQPPNIDADFVRAAQEREQITRHDVAAFVDVLGERSGTSQWLHYGLTSSDVVDTAWSVVLTQACDLIYESARQLREAIASRAHEFRDTPMVGRTHGIHAEPTTFGNKLALWALQLDRDIERVQRARNAIAVGKLSGAVGTYSNIDPRVESYVCKQLGLTPVPATQVLARDRHAEFLYACASLGASIEAFATEIRHLQRTEVSEVTEPFYAGEQKGSSAMPHKQNPVNCEQLCGLARVLRGNLQAGLENIALWHERDISHSSVERIVIPDSANLVFYMLNKFTDIVRGMEVNASRMAENLESSFGVVFSQSVLLALVDSGLSRDVAYRIVQRDARVAWDERRQLMDVLREDPEVVLSETKLAECFDTKRTLAHISHTFDALDAS